ncbi:MAG TPA: hypothetical protein VG276_09985 [Actinomycetes bacterium]|jgi:hypothetical protein|nr:hypothetical protein [Actinomycetes bacterium]
MFSGDVHGGTLAFRREVWERLARYPDSSLAEDAGFLREALHRGARIERVPAEALFLYVRHTADTWSFPLGQFIDSSGWRRVPEPPLPAADRNFYAQRSPAGPRSTPPPADARW